MATLRTCRPVVGATIAADPVIGSRPGGGGTSMTRRGRRTRHSGSWRATKTRRRRPKSNVPA
eukprot:9345456-Prorocentrum_lima.AAC.1